MERFKIILRYFNYYFKAKTKYKIHSPFVFEFCENILDDKRYYYSFDFLKIIKKKLLKNKTAISVTDFGAGSHVKNNNKRKVSNIAKSAVSPSSQGELLFRLVNYYQPKTMIEMGTSLGLTTLYQALPNQKSKFITLEGCPNISKIAEHNFNVAKINHVQIITGRFENTLEKALEKFDVLNYVFFDGNHKKEPTLKYFNACLKKADENSIFIFDDIHWSKEMELAWEEIIKHPSITISIDLFFMGIVFFKKEKKEKEHFILIETKKKPWIRGFFN